MGEHIRLCGLFVRHFGIKLRDRLTGLNSAHTHGLCRNKSIDEIIVFSPLTMDEVRDIAKLYLAKLTRQMERQGKFVEITETALNLLTEKGFNQTYGARFLKRHIDESVKLPITNEWKTATRFLVDAIENEIVVKPVDAFSLN